MKYYARYAHLKYESTYKPGDTIQYGDVVGTMGNTGQSTGPHLHFDLIQKELNYCYRMTDVINNITDISALMQQYVYFIDNELFAGTFRITTYFGDPMYTRPWKLHPGYDLVGENKTIFWNRTKLGIVHMVGTDKGYGNYIVVRYEA